MHKLQNQEKCIIKFIAWQPIWHYIMAKKKVIEPHDMPKKASLMLVTFTWSQFFDFGIFFNVKNRVVTNIKLSPIAVTNIDVAEPKYLEPN